MTSFNGSGVLVRSYDWTDDRDASVKINAARMDTEMDGLVAAINAILSSSQPFKAPAYFANGTEAAPSVTFENDPDSGLYRIGADNLGVSLDGTKRLDLTTTSLTSTVIALLPDGTVGAPAFSFSGDTDTGIFRSTTNTLAITAGGTARLNIDTSSATATVPVLLPDGSSGSPALSFSADTNLGLYRVGADNMGISGNVRATGEMQVTAYLGTKVAISGTTPTIDCDAGNFFELTTSGNTTFTFDYSGVDLTTDDVYGFVLKVTAGGTHSLTWPASVDWEGGAAPDNPASGETDLYHFLTFDGGTTWFGFWIMDAAA